MCTYPLQVGPSRTRLWLFNKSSMGFLPLLTNRKTPINEGNLFDWAASQIIHKVNSTLEGIEDVNSQVYSVILWCWVLRRDNGVQTTSS